MASSKIDKKYWIEKKNALNEIRTHDMTLQELRLFSVFLSRINPRDKEKRREVRFSLEEFQAIMDFKQLNIPYFKKIAESLGKKMIFQPLGSDGLDGLDGLSIFSRVRLIREVGGWYIDIVANDLILELLFDFKGHYFKYQLWNALCLRSKNQLRMYETLKQHERLGKRIISIKDIKEMLGIDENDYPKYYDFKRDVLEVCRKALSENTDILFTYEVHSRQGRGGKIQELKFNITKNKKHKNPLQLDKFIENKVVEVIVGDFGDATNEICANVGFAYEAKIGDWNEHICDYPQNYHPLYIERIEYLASACNNEFVFNEMEVLNGIISKTYHDNLVAYNYLQKRYREFKAGDARNKIEHRFRYFKKMLENSDGTF